MIISSVERNKKDKSSMMVYLDGSYSFTVSEEDYLSMKLYEMQEISQEQVDYIKNTLIYNSAKSKAINYLSLKVRSGKEVFEKLKLEGYPEDTISGVLEDLRSMGYVNDRLYAQKYVYDRCKLKPVSKRMLSYELQKKGISEEIITEVINDIDIDDYSVAEGLVKKKFGKYDLKDEKIIKRVYSFLHHRGYGFEFIRELLEKINNAG